MISFYSVSKALAVGMSALILGGCGDNASAKFAQQALGGLSGLGSRGEQPDPRTGLTREALDTADIRLLYVEVPDIPSKATVQEVARNRKNITWRYVDGASLTFHKGILVSTRGLGDDLMGADIKSINAAVRHGRGANALRVHDYLNGDEDIERRSFLCNIRTLGAGQVTVLDEPIPVKQIVENCQNPEFQFENRYYFASDGRLVASKQWVSPMVGYMITEELSR